MREALKTLQQVGSVENKDFNYNIEMVEAKHKVDENLTLLEALANECKIQSYARLFSDEEIKSWIYTKQVPVPISIGTDNIKLDSNNIIQIPKDTPRCGHAMLLIGWNEFGYIVQNSWRKRMAEMKVRLYYLTNMKLEKLGGILFDSNPSDSVSIEKPKLFILRKALMSIVKFLLKLIRGV